MNTNTGEETRLTHYFNGMKSLSFQQWIETRKIGIAIVISFDLFLENKSFEENCFSAGVPSFVVQEEFDRYTGYWWQPRTPQSGTHPHLIV